MKFGSLLQGAGFWGALVRYKALSRFGGVGCNRPDGVDNILAERTSVAPSRISRLQPEARASNGCPGTASTSRP